MGQLVSTSQSNNDVPLSPSKIPLRICFKGKVLQHCRITFCLMEGLFQGLFQD